MLPSFDETLARGKIGEAQIATWLRMRGYHVLPVYEKEIKEGKGPVLYQQLGLPLIAPDLLAFRSEGENRAQIRWVEAKTKSAFSWHRISKQWVTGIDLHHYGQYLKVAELSPWQVWLLFLHYPGQAKDSPPGCPTGLFGGELMYLKDHEHHRHSNHGKGGMVYWEHKTLKQLATLEQVSNAMDYSKKRLVMPEGIKLGGLKKDAA